MVVCYADPLPIHSFLLLRRRRGIELHFTSGGRISYSSDDFCFRNQFKKNIMRRVFLLVLGAVLPGCYGEFLPLTCRAKGGGKYGAFVDNAASQAACTPSMDTITGKLAKVHSNAGIRAGDLLCQENTFIGRFEMFTDDCSTFTTMYQIFNQDGILSWGGGATRVPRLATVFAPSASKLSVKKAGFSLYVLQKRILRN